MNTHVTLGGIPKIIHRIWLGDKRIPESAETFAELWRIHCPHWHMRLWRDEDVERELKFWLPRNVELYHSSRNYGEKSDIARYEILYRHGGLYVDTDVEPLRPIDSIIDHRKITFFAGKECFNRNEQRFIYGNAVIGCHHFHPAMKDIVRSLYWEVRKSYEDNIGLIWQIVKGSGPHFLTKILHRHLNKIRIFDPEVFYPGFDSENVKKYTGDLIRRISPNSYLFHHWNNTWIR
jgi:mannosyltransferase OCH1-like enzyme